MYFYYLLRNMGMFMRQIENRPAYRTPGVKVHDIFQEPKKHLTRCFLGSSQENLPAFSEGGTILDLGLQELEYLLFELMWLKWFRQRAQSHI